jgi:N6-L-threonylcarbamoyladenine synthase
MLVLGIETSCDETAAALIERGEKNRIIKEKIKSQIPLHSKYGGVVPEIASRSHLEYIDLITGRVLSESGRTLDEVDLLCVTQGPGLIGSLLVGLSFAKGLSYRYKIPLVPVDHIYSHIESAFVDHPGISYPLVALVVSGGHTSLFFQKSKFDSQIVSKTRDDAVGEVMDKIAKFFGLGYPGGPILDQIYMSGDPDRFAFTFPRMSDGSNDFSFSGYKTAALRLAKETGISSQSREFADLIASFLHSVVDYLLLKTREAANSFSAKSVIVAGGVSRNSLLREKFSEEFSKIDIPLYLPSPQFCTDNASMVAWRGYEVFHHYPDGHYFDFHINAYSRSLFRESGKHR